MNFDFLKDLSGLSYAYEHCKDAEELATTKPYLSITASRKSAELLAKFIYINAHSEEISNLSFFDILSDSVVQDYIQDRSILNAFHYIRKSGNRAVHGVDSYALDDAMAVLQDLHFVAGETACKLDLISQYPDFEPNVGEFPDASFSDDADIDQLAKQMFHAYVDEFHAQRVRDQLEEPSFGNLFEYSLNGNVDMHEYIEFPHQPKQKVVISYLQAYLFYLLRISIERSEENSPDIGWPVTLDAKLVINNIDTYSSENPDEFVEALFDKMPNANCFSISAACDGVVLQLYIEDHSGKLESSEIIRFIPDVKTNLMGREPLWNGAGMLDKMESFKRRERFTYKLAMFYNNRGEFLYEKIQNGKSIDIRDILSPDFTSYIPGTEWWSWSQSLCVEFDFDQYPQIIKKLHSTVHKHVPQDELEYCEDIWADGELGILVNGIQWLTEDLAEVQNFLDEVNRIIEPIKNQCRCEASGYWEIKDEFAVATWDWFEDGFKVIGTKF